MFDFLLLYERESEENKLTAQFPENIEISDKEIIDSLAIPYFHSKSDIFTFNTPNYFCYSYFFKGSSKKMVSFVIISTKFRPALFLDFLNSIKDSHDRKAVLDPYCFFVYIKSLITTWATNNKGDLIVNYPLNTFEIKLDDISNWGFGFNVSLLYPNIDLAWSSVISNKRILIVANSPSLASMTVVALFSLLSPLDYSEKYLLYTERGDPRFKNINDYKLVAICEKENINKTSFDIVLEANPSFTSLYHDYVNDYNRKTQKLTKFFLVLMNFCLLSDPYFDILERHIDEKLLIKSWPIFREDQYHDFQETETFKRWRLSQIDREQLRAGFLSNLPQESIDKLSPEECAKALPQILNLLSIHKRDQHFCTILKAHKSLLKNKMRAK